MLHADNWSLKFLHTLFDMYAGEIWTKSYGPSYKKNLSFVTKDNHFWQSANAILEDVSVSETIVWW